jgi:SAM-dependent methyltransferase
LNAVSIPHEQFIFIDFGSGKGRTLLLAARFPFRKVIGVEYCAQLNEVARRNVRKFPVSARQCQEIEIVEADATEFPIPDEPLVLFLNNPFAEPVMARVVNNMAVSFRRRPRRILVIYFWPYLARLWKETGFLKRLQASPAIFDTGPLPELREP